MGVKTVESIDQDSNQPTNPAIPSSPSSFLGLLQHLLDDLLDDPGYLITKWGQDRCQGRPVV